MAHVPYLVFFCVLHLAFFGYDKFKYDKTSILSNENSQFFKLNDF